MYFLERQHSYFVISSLFLFIFTSIEILKISICVENIAKHQQVFVIHIDINIKFAFITNIHLQNFVCLKHTLIFVQTIVVIISPSNSVGINKIHIFFRFISTLFSDNLPDVLDDTEKICTLF